MFLSLWGGEGRGGEKEGRRKGRGKGEKELFTIPLFRISQASYPVIKVQVINGFRHLICIESTYHSLTWIIVKRAR